MSDFEKPAVGDRGVGFYITLASLYYIRYSVRSFLCLDLTALGKELRERGPRRAGK